MVPLWNRWKILQLCHPEVPEQRRSWHTRGCSLHYQLVLTLDIFERLLRDFHCFGLCADMPNLAAAFSSVLVTDCFSQFSCASSARGSSCLLPPNSLWLQRIKQALGSVEPLMVWISARGGDEMGAACRGLSTGSKRKMRVSGLECARAPRCEVQSYVSGELLFPPLSHPVCLWLIVVLMWSWWELNWS